MTVVSSGDPGPRVDPSGAGPSHALGVQDHF